MRIVTPYAPGGISDTLARAMADALRDTLGQPVIVENRPGANGVLGAETVARAPKDGHTLGYMAYSAAVLAPLMMQRLSYRLEEFQFLTPIFRAPMVLVVAQDLPARDAHEFAALSEQRNGLAYGSIGQASPGQIVMELLSQQTGARFENVVYRGEVQAVLDMLSGNIPAVCVSPMSAIEQIRAGSARVLGLSTEARLPQMPELPTFAEAGLPGILYTYFHSLALPAGTPRPAVERIHAALMPILSSPALQARMTPDMIPAPMPITAFERMLAEEHARLGSLIRERGLTTG